MINAPMKTANQKCTIYSSLATDKVVYAVVVITTDDNRTIETLLISQNWFINSLAHLKVLTWQELFLIHD